jgi:rubrerythrin
LPVTLPSERIMQRSIVSLNPPEVLQVAISIEDRNAELYHRFAEMFTEFGDKESLEIAAVFWEMAVEERSHSWQLKQRYTELYGELTTSITEHDTTEIVEVPKLDDGGIFAAPSPNVPGRVRALNVALQAELGAQQFYGNLAKQTPPGPLRDVFLYLGQMEDGHVTYLEQKLAQNQAEEPSVQ